MRILGCLLMVAAIAVWKSPRNQAPWNQAPSQQTEESAAGPKWEYRVVALDARRCALADEVASYLNNHGKQGWELVSFQQVTSPFPAEAKGAILFRPAATGPGKEVQPQLADSFQGTVDFKLPEAQPGACRFTFIRQMRPGAKP